MQPESGEDDEGRVIPPKLDKAFLPLRVPLVDWSRHLEKEEHNDELEVDILSDILSTWVSHKYGQDSGKQQLQNVASTCSCSEYCSFSLHQCRI